MSFFRHQAQSLVPYQPSASAVSCLNKNNVPPDLIENNEDEVNELIIVVFARVSEEKGFVQDDEAGGATRMIDDRGEFTAPSKAFRYLQYSNYQKIKGVRGCKVV
jgi:hypothetical protein